MYALRSYYADGPDEYPVGYGDEHKNDDHEKKQPAADQNINKLDQI